MLSLSDKIRQMLMKLETLLHLDLGEQWLSCRVLDSRQRAAGLSLTGISVLLSLSKTHLS